MSDRPGTQYAADKPQRGTEYVTDTGVAVSTSLQQIVVLLQEISGKLDTLNGHTEEQVGINRASAHFAQQLMSTATVDEPEVRPPFADYRENADGTGWEVFLQYANQVGEWYPATATEMHEISDRNAKRRNRPR